MAWIRVEKPREILGYQNGQPVAVLDLQVGTAADLPSLGDTVSNYVVAAGSTAQIVEADEPTYVTLSGDSEEWWPDQSGTKAGKTLNASLPAPKNLGSIRDEQPIEEITEEPVETEKSVLYPDEIVKEQKKEYIESIEEPEKDGEDDDELL